MLEKKAQVSTCIWRGVGLDKGGGGLGEKAKVEEYL